MKQTSALMSLGRPALKLFCCGLILSVMPALAQHHPSPAPAPAPPPSPSPAAPPPPTNPWDQNELNQRDANKPVPSKIAKGDNCFLPPLDGVLTARVGIADLKIPAKAQREFENGCVALRSNKRTEAESYLRKAVKQWPEYSAAWVVLGQLLEAQQKLGEARQACSQPLTTDSQYLPAYLCMADISSRAHDWDQVLQMSVRALAIDPTTVALAYDYNGVANLKLHNLPEAEKSALRAVEIDKNNTDPRVHFLLAQIYEEKRDRAGEAAQLREYLKYASDPNDVAMVKHYLSELDNPK
jgi:tetratricopeptide (TPR) repeat protein